MRFATSTITLAAAGLASLASALPSEPMHFHKRAGGATAAEIILAIAPKSGDCTGASFADECETNVQAAPHLINAMAAHQLYAPAQIGAVLALMALESGEFKFNRNHFPEPGRPGQGTRNMQMIGFNLLFAKSKPELASKIPAGEADSLTDDQKNEVLALVMADEYTWETGAWFLATQCDQSVRDQLVSNPDAGWTAYMACIGTEDGPERQAYWTNAKKAFGIA